MNKINIVNHIKKIELDNNILFKENDTKYEIHILKDTVLFINLENLTTRLEFMFFVNEKVNAKVIIVKKGKFKEIINSYKINENSLLEVFEYNDVNLIKQKNNIYLDSQYATINYITKTITKEPEEYENYIFHNASNTNSSIINHGINNDGTLSFIVTTKIPKGKTNCIANQNNRIINLNEKKCSICPNLEIDEYDVVANHSAYIGSFKDEELFYLEKAGIPYALALQLLLEGFMKSKVDQDMIKQIYAKYWR